MAIRPMTKNDEKLEKSYIRKVYTQISFWKIEKEKNFSDMPEDTTYAEYCRFKGNCDSNLNKLYQELEFIEKMQDARDANDSLEDYVGKSKSSWCDMFKEDEND